MNTNEFVSGEKRFVKDIRRCRCLERIDDAYILECKIIQRGEKEYRYIPGSHFMDLASSPRGCRRLWLTDDSESQADASVDAFDSAIEKAAAHDRDYLADSSPDGLLALYCEPASELLYNCLVKYRDEGDHTHYRYMRSMTIGDIIHDAKWRLRDHAASELLDNTTAESIAENPFYIAAVSSSDVTLQYRIKLYYRIADYDECMYLSKLTGRRILPPLPEEYNRTFLVDRSGISSQLLKDSGYSVWHRLCPAMGNEATYTKWQLNPHTKTGRDHAPRDAETISFDEYVKMIEAHYE